MPSPFEPLEHGTPPLGSQLGSHHVETANEVLLVRGAVNQVELGT